MSSPLLPVLPDFRNLGVVLRVVVLAELLRLGVILATEPGWVSVATDFFLQGVLFEPVLLSAVAVLFAASPWLRRQPYGRGVLWVLLTAVLLALAWREALGWALSSPMGDPLRVAWVAFATAGAVLFYFNWRHHRLSPAWAESRLMALQARIQPHFLFNSLNSVLSLVRDEPRRAEAMLHDLSDLLRALLADSRSLVPLQHELTVARAYVAVEGVRFGPRLRVRWLCDAAPADALVPPLLLQPLVENAVRHGVEPCVDGAEITVEAYEDGGYLTLFVRNPVPPAGQSARPSNGNHMATDNIRERLDLHFDAEARFKTYTSSEGEYVVQIRLPIRRAQASASGGNAVA